MSPRILIAEDDPVHRGHLESLLNRLGYVAESAASGQAVLERLEMRLRDASAPPIDLILLDLDMARMDAGAVLSRQNDRINIVPVIVMGVEGSVAPAIAAMHAGAFDFIVKPAAAERLQFSIKNALRTAALEAEIRRLNQKQAQHPSFRDLATKSAAMDRVVRLGERAAKSAIPVLLEGERGVGKTMLARAIHAASDRRGRAFVSIDCAAPPSVLSEDIMFSSEKGVFTGAPRKPAGRFVEASGGTLFLDEIGALPIEMQGMFLRALQDIEGEAAGSRRRFKRDVRLIAATSRNLIELVKCGRFREDLYYRLNVFPIMIPALRQRREDIGDLARGFCAHFAASEGKTVRGLSAEALALLEAYDWPGNMRQLENAVFRAIVLAETDELTIAEFPQIAARVEGFDVRIPSAPILTVPRMETEPQFLPLALRDPDRVALLDEMGGHRQLVEIEADAIRFALSRHRGHISAAARSLGIGRSTLYRKMKDFGLSEKTVHTGNADTGGTCLDDAAA
jgi:DNA-binding NtrC family response regulator